MNRTVRVTNWHYNSGLIYNPEEAVMTPDFLIEVEDIASREKYSFNAYSQIKSQLPGRMHLTERVVRNVMNHLCVKPFTMYMEGDIWLLPEIDRKVFKKGFTYTYK